MPNVPLTSPLDEFLQTYGDAKTILQVPQPELVNLTSQTVRVYSRRDRNLLESYEQSGQVAYINAAESTKQYVHGIQVVTRRLGACHLTDAVTGHMVGDGAIPERENVLYIVSLFVLQHSPRYDFIAPDSTLRGAVRDDAGKLVGVTRFVGAG